MCKHVGGVKPRPDFLLPLRGVVDETHSARSVARFGEDEVNVEAEIPSNRGANEERMIESEQVRRNDAVVFPPGLAILRRKNTTSVLFFDIQIINGVSHPG